jgi:hypothetical protein
MNRLLIEGCAVATMDVVGAGLSERTGQEVAR